MASQNDVVDLVSLAGRYATTNCSIFISYNAIQYNGSLVDEIFYKTFVTCASTAMRNSENYFVTEKEEDMSNYQFELFDLQSRKLAEFSCNLKELNSYLYNIRHDYHGQLLLLSGKSESNSINMKVFVE